MHRPRWVPVLGGLGLLVFAGLLVSRADDNPAPQDAAQLTVSHPECSFFGAERERFAPAVRTAGGTSARHLRALSDTTAQVTQAMVYIPPGGPTHSFDQTHQAGSIDFYIFADFKTNGITPAPVTSDWEFIRRATLDLTGRIPTPDRVLAFVADTAADKRARLIDELLAAPEWVDKWTMYYGDLFQNTVTKPSTNVNRLAQGRNAFYQWIHDSLAAGKPYNQMAAELISTAAPNSFQDGRINYLVGGVVGGGPVQDITDQMTANTFDTFLGLAHVNCLLCHNGRGHLDSLSLWGSRTTRFQAWQLASFISHTQVQQTRDAGNALSFWSLQDRTGGFTLDYALSTTTGNRPARVAPAGCKVGQPCWYVPPQYIFNGNTPNAGESYRVALARNVTGDFQFARAAVNYLWAQFFGRGIVDPPDTFDPARLDPNNPPPAPWTLQPANAKLLNALATHFVEGGYNIKSLMREIANSQTYQLSSHYDGQWNAAWEPYFARKFVRRLWSEELHDAVAQSSGAFPSYTMTGFTDQGYAPVSYAMQLPDVVGGPSSDVNARTFLDSFLRGNRDDQPRKQDGSILQALSLMNNPFVEARLQATGANATPLIAKNLGLSNTGLVDTLYLNILSRHPAADEMAKSAAALSGANRTQAVQDLVWSLYNKVDFIFNY